jgi:hypothetical protein
MLPATAAAGVPTAQLRIDAPNQDTNTHKSAGLAIITGVV